MADPEPLARPLPRVPAHAWSWLQRSRPVLVEAADRLTGQAPSAGFFEDLRASFEQDPFVRDVLVDVVADVAFHGRVPRRRPPGASWDRGLTWWAAALAGVDLAVFEGRDGTATQDALFEAPPVAAARDVAEADGTPGGLGQAARRVSLERRALAAALRELLAQADNGQVPASAVRQLIDSLEHG